MVDRLNQICELIYQASCTGLRKPEAVYIGTNIRDELAAQRETLSYLDTSLQRLKYFIKIMDVPVFVVMNDPDHLKVY